MKPGVTVCLLSTLIVAAVVPSEGRGEPDRAASPPAEHVGSQAADFSRVMAAGMSRMHGDMMGAPSTGDPDHDFAAMMIPHHQGAVDMAKAVMLYGRDPVLRRLAEEIIVTQRQEIEVMRQRMSAMRTAAAPAPRTVEAAGQARVPASSSHDRVYTADQTSNTVSVIDPGTNKMLGVMRLGDPVPGALTPLYRGQLLVHGLGFSPDHRTLAVISVGSNSVTLIDTATNAVKGVVYVGRSPHEGFFTPDGKELWVAVRGEDYVTVIDPVTIKEVRRVQTANGPGMVLFRPDGRYAFVTSSFVPELDVVDTRTYQVVARVPQASPFSPNLAVSRDGTEVWFTLKDSGQTQVMSAAPPFRVLTTLATGPISNHVTLVDRADTRLAYVTVGAENVVKVFRRGEAPELIATIATGDLPHGIWGSPDGARVYVGLENQDAVAVIDTRSNKVIGTISVGQQPQALVYVPDAVPAGDGTSRLQPLGEAGTVAHLTLAAPRGAQKPAHATVSVNSLGPLDLVQIAASGLTPGQTYTLWLTTSRVAPFGKREALASFKANLAGAQIAQAIGPFKRILGNSGEHGDKEGGRRFLLVTEVGRTAPELVEVDEAPVRH